MESPPHEFIFIKTQMTARTSVEVFLEPYCALSGHRLQISTDIIETDFGSIGARDKTFPDRAVRLFCRGHLGATRIDGAPTAIPFLNPASTARIPKIDHWMVDQRGSFTGSRDACPLPPCPKPAEVLL